MILNETQQDALLRLIEAAEAIEADIAERNKDKSAIYQSAGDYGLDPSAVREKVSSRRKEARDPEKYRKHQDRLDEYELAIEAARARRAARSRRVSDVKTVAQSPSAPFLAPAKGILEGASRTHEAHDPVTVELTESAVATQPAQAGDQAAAAFAGSPAPTPCHFADVGKMVPTEPPDTDEPAQAEDEPLPAIVLRPQAFSADPIDAGPIPDFLDRRKSREAAPAVQAPPSLGDDADRKAAWAGAADIAGSGE